MSDEECAKIISTMILDMEYPNGVYREKYAGEDSVKHRALYHAKESLRDRIARQNPQPLTLEELRGMDGEPVYMVYGDGEDGWQLSSEASDYIFEVENRGATAYRTRPEPPKEKTAPIRGGCEITGLDLRRSRLP